LDFHVLQSLLSAISQPTTIRLINYIFSQLEYSLRGKQKWSTRR